MSERVTLGQWWELRREAWTAGRGGAIRLGTVRTWRRKYDDFPAVASDRTYRLSDLDEWKQGHPLLGLSMTTSARFVAGQVITATEINAIFDLAHEPFGPSVTHHA